MRQTIEYSMRVLMRSEGRKAVWYGDLALIERCAKMSGIKWRHPQKIIKAVLDALEQSPHFVKSYVIADFSGKKRKYRCFTLTEMAED